MKTTKRIAKAKLLQRIERLEDQAERLRTQIGVSKRGEAIFQASLSTWPERDLVVEADGRGGAKILVVEGKYPDDHLVHRERFFDSEDEACEAAERMVDDPVASRSLARA